MKRISSQGDTGLKQAFDRDISNNDEKAYSFFLVFFFFLNPPKLPVVYLVMSCLKRYRKHLTIKSKNNSLQITTELTRQHSDTGPD